MAAVQERLLRQEQGCLAPGSLKMQVLRGLATGSLALGMPGQARATGWLALRMPGQARVTVQGWGCQPSVSAKRLVLPAFPTAW